MTNGNIGRHLIIHALAGAAMLGAAQATPQKATFRDWTASLDEVNTGEDVRLTCTAQTAAPDGSWTLRLAISNGDVMPPDAYPQIVIAGAGLAKGEGLAVAFSFGDEHIDAKGLSDGKELMVDNAKATSLALLRAMAAGDKLDIAVAGISAPPLSLAGFTASYRKLGSWCGFPTTDIAK